MGITEYGRINTVKIPEVADASTEGFEVAKKIHERETALLTEIRELEQQKRGTAQRLASLAQINVAENGELDFSAFPKPVRIGQFLKEVGEPPPMFIERILPEKRLVLCAGKPKIGKSYTATDIVHCVAAGLPVFGSLKVNRQGCVLWLQMEDGEYEIAERLRRRGLEEGNDLPIQLIYERIDLSSSLAMDYMLYLYERTQPVLIVIDTAREALGIRKWDDPTEVSDKLRPLRNFAHSHCSVLLVAHNRKTDGEGGDEISGTNAFTAGVDGWMSGWKGETLPNGNRRIHYRIEGRGNMHGEICVEMDTNTLIMRTVDAAELRDEADAGVLAKHEAKYLEVLKLMQWHGGGKGDTRLLCELMKLEAKTAYRLLQDIAQKTGWIADSKERTGATGKVIVYTLTETGRRRLLQPDSKTTRQNDCKMSSSSDDAGNDNKTIGQSPYATMSDCPIADTEYEDEEI